MEMGSIQIFWDFFKQITLQSPLVRTINKHHDGHCLIQILATSVSPNRKFTIPYYISIDHILMKSFALGSINNNVMHVP